MKYKVSPRKGCLIVHLKLSPAAHQPSTRPRHPATPKPITFGVILGTLPGQDVSAKLPKIPDERH